MAIAEARLDYGTPIGAEELAKISIFDGITVDTLKKYPGAVVMREFKKGDIICREGDFGSTAFYVLHGKVDVYLESPLAHVKSSGAETRGWFRRIASKLVGKKDDKREGEAEAAYIPIDAPVDLRVDDPIAQLGTGDLFGEMTCMSFYPRSATVRAAEDCEMLEMLRNILLLLQKRSKSLKAKLDSGYKERALKNHLRSMPMFKSVPDEFLDALRDRVELMHVDPGGAIVKQGDPADAMYLIRLGFVKVSQTYPGGEMVLRYLHRGDFLGAMGILGSGVRSATCTAIDNVELVKIGRAVVEEMMAKFPAVRPELEKDLHRTQVYTRERMGTMPSVAMDQFLEQGLMQAKNLLLLDLDRCTRCDDCVRACADTHDGITRLLRDGLRYDKYLVATSCRSCADPRCMIGCPVGAIRRRDTLEIIIEDWCIGCGLCAKQCPYGNITMHEFPGTKAAVEKKATTCDLCADLAEPSCVYACPHDAALRVDPHSFFAAHLSGKAD